MSLATSSYAPLAVSKTSQLNSDVRTAAGPEYSTQSSRSEDASRGVRLGNWVLESISAQGSRSSVYRARSAASPASDSAARYAIKLLHPHVERDDAALARFRAEARIGKCVRHRHLAPVLAAHTHKSPYYMVMPLLDGDSAAQMIAHAGRMDVAQSLWFTRQTAEALESLHAMGYVHSDVRPANIFVSAEGHTTLLDLGSARRIDDEAGAMDRTLCGSIDSFAPELHVGQPATPRSDLYSLGIALFQMLTGRLPWRSREPGVIAAWKTSGTALEVREFAPGVPAGVSRFLRKLTATEPLRRPNSAREAVDELVELEIAVLRLSPMLVADGQNHRLAANIG